MPPLTLTHCSPSIAQLGLKNRLRYYFAERLQHSIQGHHRYQLAGNHINMEHIEHQSYTLNLDCSFHSVFKFINTQYSNHYRDQLSKQSCKKLAWRTN